MPLIARYVDRVVTKGYIQDMLRTARIFVFLVLGACATFPELDASVSDTAKGADYPGFLPMSQINTTEVSAKDFDANAAFDDRLARLSARAAQLRSPVIDETTRRKLDTALR